MDPYIILEEESIRGLIIKVDIKRKSGYTCLGGMTTYVKDNSVFSSAGNLNRFEPKNRFCQTMELKENEKENEESY